MTVDEIVLASGLPPSAVFAALPQLEAAGVVSATAEGFAIQW